MIGAKKVRITVKKIPGFIEDLWLCLYLLTLRGLDHRSVLRVRRILSCSNPNRAFYRKYLDGFVSQIERS